jgi:outer membrane protein OmpA-like peptidoglycan-associated protein
VNKSIAWIAVAGLALGACATKKHVAAEVGEVNRKVEGLSEELEKTQDRVGRNEERMDGLDSEVADAKQLGNAAMSRADEAERIARGKLIYEVTLSNDKVTFPFNRAELSPEAKVMIDDTIGRLLEENRGVYFEVEGHTDSLGSEEYNHRLGLERAEAVRNYLYSTHSVALNRIQVISFGETMPVVENDTKEQRSQNRRVVIKVIE